MQKTIISLAGALFFQYACCMNKAPSSASISVLGNMADVLFRNCNPSCLKTFQDINIDQNDGQLYINAFNVGQGNFIVLRKENRAVIIDAGGVPFDEEHIKIDELLCGVAIDAVFITHPHDDHFSLFNDKLFGAFTKSFANTVFYLSGKESDWKTKTSQKFLNQLSILSPVISRVQYLDNEQHEVSLLNGVVFKTFHLDPPARRDPNKLSLLLQISYMGKNVLFTGDVEGDSIARLFQTVGDLSSAASLVQNRNEITKIVQLFNYYTAAHRDFLELSSLCRSLAVTLGNCIFNSQLNVQGLINNLRNMIEVDKVFYIEKNIEKNIDTLQLWVDQITHLSELLIDPFLCFCKYHITQHKQISSLGDLCIALNTTNDAKELIRQLSQLGDLLQIPLFSIWKKYELLKGQLIQDFLSLLSEKKTFDELSQATEQILAIYKLFSIELPLIQYVDKQLKNFSKTYADYLSEDLVDLSFKRFQNFSKNYFTQFQIVSGFLGGGIASVNDIFYQHFINKHFNDVVDNESISKRFNDVANDLFLELLERDAEFIHILFEESLPFLTDSVFTGMDKDLIAKMVGLSKYSVRLLKAQLNADLETEEKELVRAIFLNENIQKRIISNMKDDIKFLPYVRIAFLKKSFFEYIDAKLTKDHADMMKKMVSLNAKRSTFKNSQIIVLPHHGTNTKNSQNILGLFAGRNFRESVEGRMFIVSSSPFGTDKLPKASTLEMAPFFPTHPTHKFIYCRDYSGFINMVDTEKPIYLTGAAPAGVITVKIDQTGNAFVLDMMRRDDNSIWWINSDII